MTKKTISELQTLSGRELHDLGTISDFVLPKSPTVTRRNFLLSLVALAAVPKLSKLQLSQSRPRVHSINVPYYSQETPIYCGPACLQMVLGYLDSPNQPPTQAELAKEMNTDAQGITNRVDIVASLDSRGFTNSYKEDNMSIEELEGLVAQDFPIITAGAFAAVNHFVTVIGYDEDEKKIILHDPVKGPNRRYDYDHFDKLWTGSPEFPGQRRGVIIPYKGGSGNSITATVSSAVTSIFAPSSYRSESLSTTLQKTDSYSSPLQDLKSLVNYLALATPLFLGVGFLAYSKRRREVQTNR